MQLNDGANPARFAQSVRTLLDEDPRRYRNFGIYWFFVKALLKRFYDRHQMPLLGNHDDPSVSERIPPDVRGSLALMLEAAAEEYRQNAAFNLGQQKVEDADGEFFVLSDPDIDS